MSKRNGNRTRQKKKPIFERRAVSDPTHIQRDGISILAAGPDKGEKPDEIQMIWHVPGIPYAQRLTFREPTELGALIEQMIAYRNFVFPDTDPIDPNTQLEEQEGNDR